MTAQALLVVEGVAAALAAMAVYAVRGAKAEGDYARARAQGIRALRRLSNSILDTSRRSVPADELLPAIVAYVHTVTALLLLPGTDERTPVRVAAPRGRQEAPLRTAVALLAAHRLSGSDAPELERAVATGLPQRGADLTRLLRCGTTSLPGQSHRRLLAAVPHVPFLVVPAVWAGETVALLIGIVAGDEAVLRGKLTRAARRVAVARGALAPARPAPKPPLRAARTRIAPHAAEMVIWLDPSGGFAASETLQDGWEPPRLPASLADLLGATAAEAAAILAQARAEGHCALGPVLLDGAPPVEGSLIALADADAQLWGYAALVRRTVLPQVSRQSAR